MDTPIKMDGFIMENLIKMDDLGVPLFLETPQNDHFKQQNPMIVGETHHFRKPIIYIYIYLEQPWKPFFGCSNMGDLAIFRQLRPLG